jgi:LysR family glycine cleavage system transcriptional activator
MKELPLNALRAFATIYETGGIRPASRALQVSHSSISRHLHELEAWIGLPLIEPARGRRSIDFTQQGEALGRAALANFRDIERTVRGLRESRRGNSVTITTTPSLAARWLLPRLHDLEAQFPWIEVSVVAEQKLAPSSDLNADIGIRMGRGPWPGFKCDPLMDDRLFPVMSPAFWVAAGKPDSNDKLRGLRLLHDRDPNAGWEMWRAEFELADLDVRPGPRFASSDLLLRAALQGLGVALARGRIAADDLQSGVLIRPCGNQDIVLPKAYWTVQSMNAPSRIAVSHVLDWLRAQANDDQAGVTDE